MYAEAERQWKREAEQREAAKAAKAAAEEQAAQAEKHRREAAARAQADQEAEKERQRSQEAARQKAEAAAAKQRQAAEAAKPKVAQSPASARAQQEGADAAVPGRLPASQVPRSRKQPSSDPSTQTAAVELPPATAGAQPAGKAGLGGSHATDPAAHSNAAQGSMKSPADRKPQVPVEALHHDEAAASLGRPSQSKRKLIDPITSPSKRQAATGSAFAGSESPSKLGTGPASTAPPGPVAGSSHLSGGSQPQPAATAKRKRSDEGPADKAAATKRRSRRQLLIDEEDDEDKEEGGLGDGKEGEAAPGPLKPGSMQVESAMGPSKAASQPNASDDPAEWPAEQLKGASHEPPGIRIRDSPSLAGEPDPSADKDSRSNLRGASKRLQHEPRDVSGSQQASDQAIPEAELRCGQQTSRGRGRGRGRSTGSILICRPVGCSLLSLALMVALQPWAAPMKHVSSFSKIVHSLYLARLHLCCSDGQDPAEKLSMK